MNTNGIDPSLVVSPKGRINNIEVVHNFGAYSVAIMDWDNKPAIGTRWNGNNSMGTPQSRGIPTWFIMPAELITPFLKERVATNCTGTPLPNLSSSIRERVDLFLESEETAEL